MNYNSHEPATKGDLHELEERLGKRFATKADLKDVKNGLWEQSLRVERRVEKLEEKVDALGTGLNAKLDKIATTLDGFVGRVDSLTTENEIGTKQIKELQKKIEKHDKRISKLEQHQQLPL